MLDLALLPNAVTCSSIIAACDKGFQWRFALRVFADMARKRIADRIAYGSIITAIGTSGEWSLALNSLAVLERSADCTADCTADGAAVVACERGCQWQVASHLLHKTSQRLRFDAKSNMAVIETTHACFCDLLLTFLNLRLDQLVGLCQCLRQVCSANFVSANMQSRLIALADTLQMGVLEDVRASGYVGYWSTYRMNLHHMFNHSAGDASLGPVFFLIDLSFLPVVFSVISIQDLLYAVL